MKRLLLIGTLPSPIGGVTIHTKRLIDYLKNENISFSFYDYKRQGWLTGLRLFFKSQIIHLHSSSPYLRFMTSFIGFFLNKTLIITYHGNLLRFSKVGNLFDLLSVFFSNIPIVLNKSSLEVAKKYNQKSILLSAFIIPSKTKKLPISIYRKINKLKERHYLFCTNAFDVSFDKNGNEIYGIIPLLKKFSIQDKLSLIISDPSGNYQKFIKEKKIRINNNILFISQPHDFFEVLKLSDAFIRNTTTDGDSLSINEALYLNKTVFATDIVSRPNGCVKYTDIDSLDFLKNLNSYSTSSNKNQYVYNTVNNLIKIYKKYE